MRLGGKWEYIEDYVESERTDNFVRYIEASIPLSFLNWAGGSGVKAGFPLDARTLNGIIQIQVNWNTISNVLTRVTGTTAANCFSTIISGIISGWTTGS